MPQVRHRARLSALRAELRRRGLQGFFIPRGDEHQGEEVPPSAERLAWISGFTGSAGLAVVLPERAALFVDGRYTLQARNQTAPDMWEQRHVTEEPLGDWLRDHGKGLALGYDPWLHTAEEAERLGRFAREAGAKLVALDSNPLDAVWQDRPAPPLAPVVEHPLEFAGRSSEEKRQELAKDLAGRGLSAAVLTQPDSIAWLLNVRGGDVEHTPLPLSFALLKADAGVSWFIDPRKLTPELRAKLGNGIATEAPERFGAALDSLNGTRVLVDPNLTAAWVVERLSAAGAEVVKGDDPCLLPRACKNNVELEGIRSAHRRDGAALTGFLAWLEGAAAEGELSETEAADRLEAFRREGEHFRGLSFSSISAAGPNGAVVHYRPVAGQDRKLGRDEIYLIDSGAQYLDGTTDVTRAVILGRPSEEMRRRYTLVLKGHIAIAEQRFPRGTTGSQLDALARQHLWQAGLDYDHGTGHGVGSFLGVHEPPQRISKMPNRYALKPGMIISNEPGYYKNGAYGIRLENLVAVRESPPRGEEEREMLELETLTLAPFDLRLVETGMLSASERAWLESYHRRVRESLTPLVDEATAAWLAEATKPLA